MIASLQRWSSLVAFPAGAALALAFAPFNVWPLAVLCPALLLVLWEGSSPRRAAQLGFWFTAGLFLAGTYWIYHSVHVIGNAPIWVALFLMVAMIAILAGYSALFGYLQARWLPHSGLLRWVVVLPAGWVLVEWFRGWFLSGFPWLALGYTQLDTPLAGIAPLLGVYGISLFVMVSAGALSACILAQGRIRFVALVLAALPWLVGVAVHHRVWTQAVGEPVKVAIVQGAVPQEMKWSIEQRDRTLDLYRKLSEPHFGAQIILWPEAALPDLAHVLVDYLQTMWRDSRASGSDVVMGLLHQDPETAKVFNGVLSLGQEAQWYDKRRLVPFGEYFPVPPFVRQWLKVMNLPYSDISAGEERQSALKVAGQKLGVTICYEDAYGSMQLDVLREATLLVNVTNDAWFGDSTAPHQHLEISRMRALEAGRALMRGANDGITALISYDGVVASTLPQFEPGVLTGVVQPRTGLTPYARIGNWPVILLCLALIVAGAGAARYRRRRRP
ncbi:MAG: apolipoprotein N-acyltransferase [Steroidobacteraceae bacterium]